MNAKEKDPPTSLNIYQRIALVQSKVPYVPKEGRFDGGGTKYDYAKESDFLRVLRPLLAEAGIAVTFSLEGDPTETAITSKSGSQGILARTYLIMELVNIDKPDERVMSRLRGDATDYGDKAIYKSYTGAKKYLLGLAFLVATGDDPEDDKVEQHHSVSTQTTRRGNITEEREPGAPTPVSPVTWSEGTQKRIDKARSCRSLAELYAFVKTWEKDKTLRNSKGDLYFPPFTSRVDAIENAVEARREELRNSEEPDDDLGDSFDAAMNTPKPPPSVLFVDVLALLDAATAPEAAQKDIDQWQSEIESYTTEQNKEIRARVIRTMKRLKMGKFK